MESRADIDLDLNRYLLMIKRQWIPAVSIFVTTVALSALAITRLQPSYKAEGKLLFKLPSFQVLGNNLLRSSSEGESGDLKSLVSTQNPISTEIEVISSYPILQRTIDKLKLKNKKGELLEVEDLQKSLTLKIVGGTDILTINYQSLNPDEAAAVVNTVMNLYLENNILTTRTEAEMTYKFMVMQLSKVQAAVNLTEIRLRKFKQENNIVDLPEETKSAVTIIGNLQNEINNVQAQLEDINAQADTLRQKIALNSQQAIAISSLNNSPAVQGILTQLQEIERQLAIESSRYFDDNPVIISLNAKKANLNNLLQTQIQETMGNSTQVPTEKLQIGQLKQQLIQSFLQAEIQRTGLTQKLASLYNSLSVHQRRVKIIPLLVQNQRDLERKVEVAQSTYETILKKAQELKVAQNNNTANARIISQAKVPNKPLPSQTYIILVLGVMVGAFFATSTILLIEMRDRSLKTVQEIKEKLPYTLLGTLPLIRKKSRVDNENTGLIYRDVMVLNAPKSQTSEMYRMIQANLKFLSSDKLLKSVVITSAVPEEGRSRVAANLAAAIAQLGRKVLLIDADMRIPSQQKIWSINSTAGLSDILIGEAKIEDAIGKIFNNLDILPAGIKPPNPLALIDSSRMALMMDKLRSQYDFIIIDSPPFLLAADAFTLGQMSDGIILVARPGMLDYNSADKYQELLQRSHKNILGLVVNGTITNNEPSNYLMNNYYLHEQDVANKKTMKTLEKI